MGARERCAGVDGESLLSFPSQAPGGSGGAGARSTRKAVDQEAYLAMQEECRRVKQRELATEEKVRQLTAQLARTEEAAKRALLRSDASARGGAAQRLLDAERELARAKAERAELAAELERVKKAVADHKRAAGEAKRRLEAALQDQRRLAQQVGRLESARSLGLIHQGGGSAGGNCPASGGNNSGGALSPEAARRFAAQQEELARAREEVDALRAGAVGGEEQIERRFRNLVGGLEGEILALARKLQGYEQQLCALGVALPGPYEPPANPLLAAVDGVGPALQAALWVLEEWRHEGALYLRDPLNNGVYSYSMPTQQPQAQARGVVGATVAHAQAAAWPQPVGLFCAGSLLAAPPRQALKLFLSLGEAVAGCPARAQALHAPLMQAAGSLEAAAGVLERVVQHRVALSDVGALLACLGTETAAVIQAEAFAASLRAICAMAEAVAGGGCRQLKAVQRKVHEALERCGEEALRFLLGRAATGAAGGAPPGAVQYYDLVQWLHMLSPGLGSEEVWAAVLWLRAWDLHASGGLPPADALRAFQFGAVWRIKAPALSSSAGTGARGGVRESLAAAREVERQLGAGKEVARLELAVREREEVLARQGREMEALAARLREAEAALRATQRALDQQERGQQRQRGSSSGSEAPQPGEAGTRLRLKYLQAKTALEGVTACNTRLIKELEECKAQLAALRQRAQQPRTSPASEVGAGAPPPAAPGSPGLAPAGGALHLQQQLTEARHFAAQLQIELEAAEAKLAIFRAHPVVPSGGAEGAMIKAVWPPLPGSTEPPACRAERLGSAHESKRLASVAASATARRLAAAASPGQAGGAGVVPVPEELRGLAEHETIVELHVHAASLGPHAAAAAGVGPPGLMTFLTLDFYQHETQLTPILEGPTPQFNTTCQFVAAMDDGLVAHLREGHLQVELHACRAPAGGAAGCGGVDYVTLGAGRIPLSGLLEGAGAPRGHQQCELLDSQGLPLGNVQFALAALRPIRAHPQANQLGQGGASSSAARPQQQLGSGGLPEAWALAQDGQAPAGSTACSVGSGGGGYEETTYIHYTRKGSPSPSPVPGAPLATKTHMAHCFAASCHAESRQVDSNGLPASTPPPPVPPPSTLAKLSIAILGCRDLRVADSARARPYVSLSFPGATLGGGGSGGRHGRGKGWLHETRPAKGTSPAFGDRVAAWATPPPNPGAPQAQEPSCLEAVVFDDALGSPEGGLVGVARVPLPGASGGAPAAGGRGCHPLVHPATGRHAGLVELELAWD